FRFVLLNRALCEMVGYAREEMVGKTDYEFFPKEEADFFRAVDEEVLMEGRTLTVDAESITDASGARHVFATTKVAVRAPNGQVTHLVGIIHDITRIQAIEEELRMANVGLEAR